jgi:hypothetical protein
MLLVAPVASVGPLATDCAFSCACVGSGVK